MSTPSTTRRGIRRCGALAVRCHHHLLHHLHHHLDLHAHRLPSLQVALAFRSIALPTEHQQGLYRAVAAILHLGNVTFNAADDDACAVGDASALGAAADFLGVAYATFEEALTSRTMQVTDAPPHLGSPSIHPASDPTFPSRTMQSMSKSIYKIPLKASEAVRSAAAA